VVELSGFLGPSDQGGYVRLYQTLDLSAYVEIPLEGIIFADPPSEESPAEPRKIYVVATTKLDIVQTVEASFLKGSIRSNYPCGVPDPCCVPHTTSHGPGGTQPTTGTPCTDDRRAAFALRSGGQHQTGNPCDPP
jgi:hypothetical protein